MPYAVAKAVAEEEEASASASIVPEFVIDPPDASVPTLIPYAEAEEEEA